MAFNLMTDVDWLFSGLRPLCYPQTFDPIAKQIVMDMYPNMYNVCTKFERKLTKHV